jgi:hypothetical protein
MADVSITLGVDGKALTSGLNQARQQVETFGKTSEKAMSNRGGNRAAGISMQIQDIAVQAQMGTSALTIFSQQAPQLLSVFGNFGALAGGFAAVGGAAFTFGQKSSEAFRTVLNDAAALNSEIARLAGSGATLESSLDAFTKIKDAQKAMSAQSQSRQDGGGFGQMSQELLSLFGLAESNYDQTKESEIATVALKKQQVRLQNEIVKASGNEVMLAQLRAAGDDRALDALDRKLKLEAQIQKIKSFGLDSDAETKLIENATRISELQKKQQVNTYDIAKNIQDQANAANKILAPYQQFLNYLDQAKQKQDALNAAAKAARQATQTKVESQKNFAQSLQEEVEMMKIRATGDTEIIKYAEREAQIKSRALQIQKELGKNAAEALAYAREIQDIQDAADKKSSGDKDGDGIISDREQRKIDLEQRRRVRRANAIGKEGASAKQGRLNSYQSNLDIFDAMQMTNPDGSRAFGIGEAANQVQKASQSRMDRWWANRAAGKDPSWRSISEEIKANNPGIAAPKQAGTTSQSSSNPTVAAIENLTQVVQTLLTVA